MEGLIREWDGECVSIRFDRATGSWIFIAIHDRTLGMAMGGCRLNIYSSPRDGLRDALRLSKGMTMKWAAIDFPFGGGKAVLAVPRPLDAAARENLLLRFGELVETLGGAYGTGVDLGTSSEDMDIVGRRTDRVFGRSSDHGGSGDPGPWTALGVYSGLLAACEHVFGEGSVAGRTVLLQGVGGVGRPLARRLREGGASLILTDAIFSRAQALAEELGATTVGPEAVYDTDCDIFAPCAIGGILNERSIPRLRCRIVGGSANNQLERDSDADLLHARGILYAPDFVINAGGAIAHGAIEVLRWAPAQAAERVRKISDTLAEIMSEAQRGHEAPLHEAIRRADRVLANARANRETVSEPQPA
jgi:leucine dehydrogenase